MESDSQISKCKTASLDCHLTLNIVCWENAAEEMLHGSKVNYVKIFLVEQVSSETQQNSKFYE